MGYRLRRAAYIEEVDKKEPRCVHYLLLSQQLYSILSFPAVHHAAASALGKSCVILTCFAPCLDDGPVVVEKVKEGVDTSKLPGTGISWNPMAGVGLTLDAAIGYSNTWTKTFTHKARNATITATKRKQLATDGCGQYVAVPILVA